MKATFLRWQEAALCLVRKWWRPLTQLGIAGGMIVNGVVIPIIKRDFPDLTALAAYVAAATAAFGVRAWEKHKSADSDDAPA